MTLVNKPELLDYNTIITLGFITQGYDKMVEYHYQCKSNERHEGKWHDWSDLAKPIIYKGEMVDGEPKDCNENFSKCSKDDWCDISTEKNIILMRILIPSLELDSPYSPTSATVGMINIENEMLDKGYLIPSKEPNTNILLNVPERDEKFIKEMEKNSPTWIRHKDMMWKQEIKDGEKEEVCSNKSTIKVEDIPDSDLKPSFEVLKKKAELCRKKYPDYMTYIGKFIEVGATIITKKGYSTDFLYKIMKDSIEIFNPQNSNLKEDDFINFLSKESLTFMKGCLDKILAEK